MSLSTYTPIPPNNYWAASKDFQRRGGFVNGLNPTVVGRIWYVNPNTNGNHGVQGSDSNSGRSPLNPFATVSRAFEFIDSYDIIVLAGVVREQLVAPLGVFDVTIVGAGNLPRQATSGGVPTGGGSTWMAPASGAVAATALLELIEQGWAVENILFVPHTSSPGILLTRAEDTVHPDPSHAVIRGCRFAAGTTNIGVKDVGGCYHIVVEDCIFQTGVGIQNTSTGVDVPTLNQFLNNIFDRCTTGISGSYNYSTVRGNRFRMTVNDINFPKINMKAVSNQGTSNFVIENYFPDATANYAINKGYTPATSDVWRNYVTDVAAWIVAVPA